MGHHPDYETKTFVCARHGLYNLLSLGGEQRPAPTVGLVEIDADWHGTFLTRLNLVADNLFHGRNGNDQPIAGFLRLEGVHVVQPGEGILAGEIPLLFGACETEEDLKYFVRPVKVRVDLRYAGSTLTGSIAGRLPDDFAYAPGVEFNLPILGTANGFGRFIARFRGVSELDSACLTVAGDGWRRQVHGPGEVDLLVPSHSTIWVDWSKRLPDGRVHRERDVLPDVILAPGQSTDLDFTLFEPAGLPVLAAVLLAQERDANASLSYDLREASDGSGEVEISTVIKGRGNRYVLIDMIVASNDPERKNPQVSALGYFGGAAAGAIPISCNLKPPGPNSPGSNPVLSNPPGGGGGVPGDDGGGGGTPKPNSSTSDGGNSCDANYGAVLPPSGVLTLRTVVKPIGDDRSEVAFVGVFDGGHKLNVGRVTLQPEGGKEDGRETNPIWLVPRAVHRLLVDMPRDRTLREVTTVELAVDTRERLITTITLYRPSRDEVADGKVIVIGDLGSGMAFRLSEDAAGTKGRRIALVNESGGWLAVPNVPSKSMTIGLKDSKGREFSHESTLTTRSDLYGVPHLIVFVAAGIEEITLDE